jgi:hypothetical protein
MWAGYMALINQQAVENGNSPLGFVNPAIYNLGVSSGYAAAFHDITSGSNGEPTTTGYDLATGWGSPNSGLIAALAGSGGGGGPAVSLSATSLKWSAITVGTTANAKKVTVTNSGNATLTISTIAVSGDFALKTLKASKTVTPCVNGSTLAAGKTCEISVTFTPKQKGDRTGDVTFTDNAPDSPQQVSLTGTGK